MLRPLGVLTAAVITVPAIFVAAPAALAATPNASTTAAAAATSSASALATLPLGALTSGAITSGALASGRAAAQATKVESIDETVQVKVGSAKYDLRAVSTGSTAKHDTFTLYLAGKKITAAVRDGVQYTVTKHGAKKAVYTATTTFPTYTVLSESLITNPLTDTLQHFSSQAALVSQVKGELAQPKAQIQAAYGALLRDEQMLLDVESTILSADSYVTAHPTATDLTGVVPTHTLAGSGGYQGTVTIQGTVVKGTPTRLLVQATDSQDAAAFQELVTKTTLTVTETIGGHTYTITETL